MPLPAWLIQPGTVPIDGANATMHRLAERRLADEIPDTVILLEHPPVFSAGRRAKVDELLWSSDEVEARGGLVRMIDR
jgi:lipoyl(octanoyl) transferase